MNKLAVIVPFYKRHELTKLCFKRLKSQSKRFKFDIIVAGSEGIESKNISRGLKYIEVKNVLGLKLNSLLAECKAYDGVIVLGSDNFISDSIIELYKTIDTKKPVYYSFDDIFIYSKRLNKLVSDMAYTENGQSIAIARLFTKPLLEKMNYKVWSDNRVKGLDGDSEKRLKSKGIKEIILPLDNHFIIDVKVDSNITSQDVALTGKVEHSLDVITTQLKDVGADILKLVAVTKERITLVKEDKIERIDARVIIPFHQYENNKVYSFKKYHYKVLLRAGYIEPIN